MSLLFDATKPESKARPQSRSDSAPALPRWWRLPVHTRGSIANSIRVCRTGSTTPRACQSKSKLMARFDQLKQALKVLTARVSYAVPDQDLRIDESRLPALPSSRFILRNVRVRA